jgi:hypothetical protein
VDRQEGFDPPEFDAASDVDMRTDRCDTVRKSQPGRSLRALHDVVHREFLAVCVPCGDGAEKIAGRVVHTVGGESLVEMCMRLCRGKEKHVPSKVERLAGRAGAKTPALCEFDDPSTLETGVHTLAAEQRGVSQEGHGLVTFE